MDLDEMDQVMDTGQAVTVECNIPLPYKCVLKGLLQQPVDCTHDPDSWCNDPHQDIKQRLCKEEHLNGEPCTYREQDLISGVQATAQCTFMGEPILSVHRAVRPVIIKGDKVGETQVQVSPCTDLFPLQSECDPKCNEEETEPEADIDLEKIEQLDDMKLFKVTMDQQISTISVNLKVSRELLQQANKSLDQVEKHLEQDHIGEDIWDSVTVLRDAPSPSHTVATGADSFLFSSMSSTNLSGVSTAVGPHSKRYSLLPHREDQWVKNLETQLLSRDWEVLSKEELSLWQSHFPAEEQQCEQEWALSSGWYVTKSRSVGADHSTETLSQYRSAVDDSCLCNQQMSTSHKNSVERPEAGSRQLPDTAGHYTNHESLPSNCKNLDTDPGTMGAQVTPSTNVARSNMAILAELSSITHTSAHQEELYRISGVNRRAGPSNSTPCVSAVQKSQQGLLMMATEEQDSSDDWTTA